MIKCVDGAVKPSVSGFPSLDVELFRENRQRLCDALKAAGAPAGSVVVLQGTPEVLRDDTGEIHTRNHPGYCLHRAVLGSASSP